MAYAIKYRIQYKRISNSTTTIDILQDGYTGGTITNLDTVDNPLEITFDGDVNNIYKPTLGSGASIKILATPLTLLDLFTDNPQEFIVKIYNGNSGSNLIWQGFINSEIYSEDYSASNLTPITIYCNNGMSTLDTIPYYNLTADTYYTGTTNISTIFGTILDKLSISFDTLYYVTDYRIVDYARNIFLYLRMAQENFVNESGVPMSCRKVLESITGGLGLVIKFRGSKIYMYDPINFNDVSVGQEYGTSPVVGYGGSSASFGGVLDLSATTFNWFETGAKLDIVPALNEVQIKYNPYNFSEYKYDFNNQDNLANEGSWSSATAGGSTYYYNSDVLFDGWENDGVLISIVGDNAYGLKENSNDSPLYCWRFWDASNYVKYTFPFSNITMDKYNGNLTIKISADIYLHTKGSHNNIFSTGTSHQIYDIKIPISVKVGDKYYKSGTWTTGYTESTDCTAFIVRDENVSASNYTESNISDKWTTTSILLPISPNSSHTGYDELIQGNIELTIWDRIKTYFASQVRPNSTYLYRLFIKNVQVELIDSRTGKAVGNDGVNTKVIISPNLTGKEALVINTTTGIGTYGCSRAAIRSELLVNVGTNLVGLIRSTAATGGTVYNTSKLILQSVISQYKQPRFKLTGTLDVKDYLIDIDLYLIKDSNYLSARRFYIVNGVYSDYYESYNAEMLEIAQSRDNIE